MRCAARADWVGELPHPTRTHPDDEADIALLAEHADGWFDGEGARISPDTLKAAVTLINQLRAAGIRGPVIGGDPDGAVTLHWVDDPVAVVVTVGPGNLFSVVRTNVDTHEHAYMSGLIYDIGRGHHPV